MQASIMIKVLLDEIQMKKLGSGHSLKPNESQGKISDNDRTPDDRPTFSLFSALSYSD